eukprot:scaffold78483_cov26-Prasinocladus_malaysianus.AAC.1
MAIPFAFALQMNSILAGLPSQISRHQRYVRIYVSVRIDLSATMTAGGLVDRLASLRRWRNK